MGLDKTNRADQLAPDWTGAPQEQIARTELGIARVRVETADTRVASAGSTSASSVQAELCRFGGAVQAACREVAAELLARASVAAGGTAIVPHGFTCQVSLSCPGPTARR